MTIESNAAKILHMTVIGSEDGKRGLLEMVDELRKEVESGRVVALFIMPVLRTGAFETQFLGDIMPSSLAGMLGRAWLDAQDNMQ